MLDYGFDLSSVERDLVLPALVAEGDELDILVSARADWSKPTPAAGWTIAHQIAHLASADANVLLAIRTPEAFDAVLKQADAAGSQTGRTFSIRWASHTVRRVGSGTWPLWECWDESFRSMSPNYLLRPSRSGSS